MASLSVGDLVVWRDDWNPAWCLKREDAIREYGEGPLEIVGIRSNTVDIRHPPYLCTHGFASVFFKKINSPA